MQTRIITDNQAIRLAALYGLTLTRLRVGEEGFLMPHHGSKLILIRTEAGLRFALSGYSADHRDVTDVLALAA